MIEYLNKQAQRKKEEIQRASTIFYGTTLYEIAGLFLDSCQRCEGKNKCFCSCGMVDVQPGQSAFQIVCSTLLQCFGWRSRSGLQWMLEAEANHTVVEIPFIIRMASGFHQSFIASNEFYPQRKMNFQMKDVRKPRSNSANLGYKGS